MTLPALRMDKDVLYEDACVLYFDILASTGKPPRMNDLCKRLAANLELEEAMVKGLLRGPEFDTLLLFRRKRRIIEEAALKVTAAEYAERIATLGLAELVDRIESGADISNKDLIAAVKLASELNEKVDQSMQAVTGSNDITINVKFKELLLNVPPERRAAIMGETMRRISAPGEVIDGDCTEG